MSPAMSPSNKPGNEPRDKPGIASGNEPGNESGDESGNEPGHEPGNASGNESGKEAPAMSGVTLGLDPRLLDIIVCPQCHGDLAPAETAEGGELICQGSCGLAYPVRDRIPVLLVDEARKPD